MTSQIGKWWNMSLTNLILKVVVLDRDSTMRSQKHSGGWGRGHGLHGFSMKLPGVDLFP